MAGQNDKLGEPLPPDWGVVWADPARWSGYRKVPITFDQDLDDLDYWLSRPIEERIGAIWKLQQDYMNFIKGVSDETESDLPRVYRRTQ